MNSSILMLGALSLMMFATNHGEKIQPRRYYTIKNSNTSSFLTVGGGSSPGVKIVTEDKHGSDPRQAFYVGDGAESHLVSPRAQNTFSTLLIGLDINTGLLFQQHHNFGARHQWWIIHDLGNSSWSMQNVRTGFCLSTKGKNTQVFGTVCDRSSPNQSWLFTAVDI